MRFGIRAAIPVRIRPVHVAWRRDLEQLLRAFVADHRGLTLGRMFGAPGAFAGRKLFARVVGDGITVRLPHDAQQLALDRGACGWTPIGRRKGDWVIFRPSSAEAARAIAPFLEIGARHVVRLALAPAPPERLTVESRAAAEPGIPTPRAQRPRRRTVPAPRPLRLPKRLR
jgi:hypothetical protein